MNNDTKYIEEQFSLLSHTINNKLFEIIQTQNPDWKKILKDEIEKIFKKINHHITLKDLPNRADQIYTRIENYKDYEFTHCIAYEMAIRNEKVIKLTSIMEKLNNLNYDIYKCIPDSELEEKIIEILDFEQEILESNKNNNLDNTSLLNKINSFKSKLDTNYLEKNLDETQISSIMKSFKNIIAQYDDTDLLSIINTYQKENIEPYLKQNNTHSLSSLFNTVSTKDKITIIQILLYSIESKLENEYYVVNEQKSIKPEYMEEFISRDTNNEPSPEINEHIYTIFRDSNYKENYIQEKSDGYTAYQGASKDDNSFRINKVIPNFAQPLRMFNTMEISINPSLPLNDLLSFVKKIKEDYDKKDSFKSFFELLNEELDNEEFDKNKANGIKFSKVKWADLFYIYDYYKFYKNKKNKKNKKNEDKKDKKDKKEENYSISEQLSFQLTFYHNSLHNKNNPNNLKPIPEALSDGKLDFDNFSYTKEYDFDNELYLSEEQIRKFYYKKISNLIEGENPEYKKLIADRNHDKNSLIDGKNNASKDL